MDWGYIFSVTLQSAFGIEAIVFGLMAIGLNLQFGYTGLLNFGQSAFLAVAAYSLAVLVTDMGFTFWVGIGVGLLAAVVLALLLGIPTLRLRADYLAIVTIAAAEIVRLLVRSVALKDIFGGSDGLRDFSAGFYALNPVTVGQYSLGPVSLNQDKVFVLIVGWVLVVLSLLIVWMLVRSPWGRILKGIREDEDAVRSLGKNVY
ncbi:MAG: branched-chain amino acid ABC transporter permease, partial [Candidatus Nanopelagicales bacterium]|nr:branched-chain amino acid ABC transporter permease [Candidatus Nanopelagicales bacterium]